MTGFRQSMAWLHGWAGLLVGWLLYFVFVTGTIGYFNPEIDHWMRPEEPVAAGLPSAEHMATLGLARLAAKAPGAQSWSIQLPGARGASLLDLDWRGGPSKARGTLALDPNTGQPLAKPVRDTGGGRALYVMHYELRYMPDTWGIWIVGVCSVAMLLAIVTGIIAHKKIFRDFFTFRPNKKQRSWLDGHNLVSVVTLPFCLMITYSGLVFFDYQYVFAGPRILYGAGQEARFYEELSPRDPPHQVTTGQPAALAPIGPILDQARRAWGPDQVSRIGVALPGDAAARITLQRRPGSRISRGQAETLVFAGATGAVLTSARPAPEPISAFRAALLGLHEGLFANGVLRWLYFLSGVLGTAMIGTGLVLWTVKRRQKLGAAGQAGIELQVIERLNAGVIVGLPIAVAAYFWANRLIPAHVETRAAWEIHVLFLTLAAALTYSACRPVERSWRELCAVASLAFAALPFVNLATTDRHLGVSLPAGDWVLAGFDLCMLATGAVFAVLSAPRRRGAAA